MEGVKRLGQGGRGAAEERAPAYVKGWLPAGGAVWEHGLRSAKSSDSLREAGYFYVELPDF